MDLKKEIETYIPFNEQEEKDKELMLAWLETHDFHERPADAHFTASAWIVSPDRQKVLMCYHNIYRSWSWLGGHVEGKDESPLRTALREVKEESGLRNVRAADRKIFSLEILAVQGHEKKGIYVPSHRHLNLTYLIEADDQEELYVNRQENSSLAWFAPEDAIAASTEPWMVERVYRKLVEKSR